MTNAEIILNYAREHDVFFLNEPKKSICGKRMEIN